MVGSVFIAAISSDIGSRLAQFYCERGSHVIGAYRSKENLGTLKDNPGITLVHCDVSEPESVRAAMGQISALNRPWERFISAIGQLSPIGGFFERNFDDWATSLSNNSIGQLHLLHALYPYREHSVASKIAFLVGGGVNGPFKNYSAYCLGKIVLVKMCELLDDEYPDMHAVAIGTGWVNTKIHRQTLAAADDAGMNYDRTLDFISSGEQGTTYEDIFNCIEWCFSAGREATGGRNFSIVHDDWRTDPVGLLKRLVENINTYKLRRYGN